jgi:hypothetical protein
LVSTFPAAEIYVQKQEWEDARAGRSTMSKTYLRSTFEPMASQVKLVEGEETVLDDIRLRPRPGHTWGLQSIEFDDGQGTVCFPSDVMPTRSHVGAAYSMGYDMLPWDNMQTKQKLLTEALESSAELRQQLTDFEMAQSSLFEQTAENRARNKTILWWTLQLSHLEDEDGKEEEGELPLVAFRALPPPGRASRRVFNGSR